MSGQTGSAAETRAKSPASKTNRVGPYQRTRLLVERGVDRGGGVEPRSRVRHQPNQVVIEDIRDVELGAPVVAT